MYMLMARKPKRNHKAYIVWATLIKGNIRVGNTYFYIILGE